MLKHLLLLLTVSLVYCFPAQAQTYEPGLLVRANGDTLRGEIENDFWVSPPTFVRFRATPDSPGELFRPRKLRLFRITGGRYFRYEALPLDRAAETRLDRLPNGYHPNVQIDSVMAEVLLDGPAELLRIVKFSTTHFVVRRPGQPPLDLSEQKYLRIGPSGNTKLVDGNNYRGLLGVYFGDCPAADQAAQAAPFTPEGLASVVLAFNTGCTTASQPTHNLLTQAAPRRRVAFQGGVLAGGRSDHFNTDYDDPTSRQFNPFAGLYGDFFLPNRAIAVYVELSASRYHGQGRTLAYYNQVAVPTVNGGVYYTSTPVYSTFTYRAWLGTARVGLRYFFQSAQEQRWFVSIGLDVRQFLFPAYTIIDGPAATPSYSDLGDIRFALPLPTAGLGWRRQRFTAFLDAQLAGTYRAGLSYCLTHNPDSTPALK